MFHSILRTALLAAMLAGVALADPIQLAFTGAGVGFAGSPVTLVASVTNTSGMVQSLDGLSFTFVSPFVDFDDSAFFATWPLSLDASGPGSMFGPAAMFDVVIPVGTAAGNYTGNLVNVYGDGGGTLLTTQSFDIQVVADVPEPATAALMLGGLVVLALGRAARKRLPAA